MITDQPFRMPVLPTTERQPSAGISRARGESEDGRGTQQQSSDVAGHLIDLEVHTCADDKPAQRRYGLRVRNNVDTELVAVNFVDGQTDTVDGNRSLAGDVASKVGRN